MRHTLALGLWMLVTAGFAGCGDDQVTTRFGFACGSCTNEGGVIMNLGPTESPQACATWGAENQCAEAELVREGECGGSLETNAACIVADCNDDPSQGCPSVE